MGVGGRWVGPLRSPSASSRSPARAAGCPRAPPRRPPAPAGSGFSSAPPPASCSRPSLGAAAAGCGGRGRLLRSGRRYRTPERPAAPPRPRRAAPHNGGAPSGPGPARKWRSPRRRRRTAGGCASAGGGHSGRGGARAADPGNLQTGEILRMLAASGRVEAVGALRDTWRAGHGRVAGQRARDFTWTPSAPPWLHVDPG